MFSSSLGKKYLMALTGLVLIGFVFVHMAGNLQVLAGQAQINAYAHSLQSLPLVYFMGFPTIFIGCRFNSCLGLHIH
jgi:succinate dehydrogenase / fumarate reductase cytochrome b subunit